MTQYKNDVFYISQRHDCIMCQEHSPKIYLQIFLDFVFVSLKAGKIWHNKSKTFSQIIQDKLCGRQ